jgi:hypothetical protein
LLQNKQEVTQKMAGVMHVSFGKDSARLKRDRDGSPPPFYNLAKKERFFLIPAYGISFE